jgi:hypothetical protein
MHVSQSGRENIMDAHSYPTFCPVDMSVWAMEPLYGAELEDLQWLVAVEVRGVHPAKPLRDSPQAETTNEQHKTRKDSTFATREARSRLAAAGVSRCLSGWEVVRSGLVRLTARSDGRHGSGSSRNGSSSGRQRWRVQTRGKCSRAWPRAAVCNSQLETWRGSAWLSAEQFSDAGGPGGTLTAAAGFSRTKRANVVVCVVTCKHALVCSLCLR